MPALSPYATTELFGRTPPTHIPDTAPDDLARVRAYETYEDLYHNQQEIFSVVLKNEAGNEVYRRLIPSARTIVEAMNRYLGRGLSWIGAPPVAESAVAPGEGTPAGDEAVSTALAALGALFTREEFGAKFLALKRWLLIRGDAMLHITADPAKAEGRRITIAEINPGSYFPIRDPGDAERVIGCYIVNVILDDAGEQIVQRLEYRRMIDQETAAKYGAPLDAVFVKLSFWTLQGWDDRKSAEDMEAAPVPARFGGERFKALLAGTPLPQQITAIPVYHFRNGRRGGQLFGTSEIQGIETLICGVNQTATDEEVTIALQGLGVYYTDSGRPVDENGNEQEWVVSPGIMLELKPGSTLGRVQGVSSITPSLEHIGLLKSEAREASATPDVAVGRVEVQAAESGVALAIQMAPMIAKKEEKEEEITAKLEQFLFDLLNGWLPAYEGYSPQGVTVSPVFDEALPKNRQQIVDQVVAMVQAKVISAQYGRTILEEQLGMSFPSDIGDQIAGEASALLDAAGARMDAALEEGVPA